ncbi:MAG: SDR family oxidoreductase [Hyphomicrobiales bacterium]|nr:SDR family oxidoreductase [Hyphomicrobiales bacterium]
MDLNVRGKVAWITGGGEGIGKLTAMMLAEEGAEIILCDLDEAKVQKAAEEIRAKGVRVLPFKLDVRDKDQVDSVMDRSLAEFNNIDLLAHVPGRGERKSFLQTSREDWDFSIQLNLYGPLNTIGAVINHMAERKTGKIVTVISDAGKLGEPRNCVYSAAKAGVAGFTKALAQEVGPNNVNVNCVALGRTQTPAMLRTSKDFVRSGMDPKEYEARALRRYPMRRFGEPEDVANVMCFLLSDRSRHITGQIISVDGGYCMA